MRFTKRTYKASIKRLRKPLHRAINDSRPHAQEAREVLSLKLSKIIARAKREGVDVQ